ncbi:MAG: hypothetical protein SWH78_07600 [Thermodesulfobacteriota bacterium]|nr:hypothetical protein [Thermodesulfobacteriota bacterium]
MEITIDLSNIFVPSILRNFVKASENDLFAIDTEAHVAAGDIVLVEAIPFEPPQRKQLGNVINYGERLMREGETLLVKNEIPLSTAPLLSVVGNRFSTKACAGGHTNPLTGQLNALMRPGQLVWNLGNFNLVGILNYSCCSEQPAKLMLLGRLVGYDGKSCRLSDYPAEDRGTPTITYRVPLIVVVGDDTECGKTECCRQIARCVGQMGYQYVYQKITGGPRVRDLVKVCCEDTSFEKLGGRVPLETLSQAGDFTDLGYPSSHTVDNLLEFVARSLSFLVYHAWSNRADMAIVEIAGNLHQVPNLMILKGLLNVYSNTCAVAAAKHGIESTYSIVDELLKLGIDHRKLYVSGLVTQAVNSRFLKDYVEKVLKCTWIPSAVRENRRCYEANNWQKLLHRLLSA